jgi:hypothetical protein
MAVKDAIMGTLESGWVIPTSGSNTLSKRPTNIIKERLNPTEYNMVFSRLSRENLKPHKMRKPGTKVR